MERGYKALATGAALTAATLFSGYEARAEAPESRPASPVSFVEGLARGVANAVTIPVAGVRGLLSEQEGSYNPLVGVERGVGRMVHSAGASALNFGSAGLDAPGATINTIGNVMSGNAGTPIQNGPYTVPSTRNMKLGGEAVFDAKSPEKQISPIRY